MHWYKEADSPHEVPKPCRRAARAPGVCFGLGRLLLANTNLVPQGRQLETTALLMTAVGRVWQIAGGREREIFRAWCKVSLGNGW